MEGNINITLEFGVDAGVLDHRSWVALIFSGLDAYNVEPISHKLAGPMIF